jgi:DNA processing protein
VPAEPFRFPARNRIIAGLARAVVIVEGADGSGSLITAEHALDLGREVFALAGAVNNPLARAPLSIIRDGATMIRGAEDLLADLGLESDPRAAILAQLNLVEDAVLRHLEGPTLPDLVARELGCEIGDVMGILLGLEMKGLVRSLGGRFEQTNLAATSS